MINNRSIPSVSVTYARKDIDQLLLPILSEALDDDQERHKIANLLSNLRRAKKIKNFGSNKTPEWRLAE
jgi:ATP-dependent DNA helicase RecG